MRAEALALAALVGLAALAGCGGGDDGDQGALTTSERKYCTLVKQFKSRMPTVSREAEPQEFAAAMGQSMARNQQYFEDLLEAAPGEIKADVDKALAALRRVAAGDITAYDGLDLTRADQWEEDHCNRS